MVEEKRPDQLVEMHFYDIETLNNIFTLTNYYPEENKVIQYFLPDEKLSKIIDAQPDFLQKLTDRVRLRNKNFTPGRITKTLGNGNVEIRDLRTVKANLQLAREFGMSTASNPNNPLDDTSIYPASFRLVCDTDHDNKTGDWQPRKIINRYNNSLHIPNTTEYSVMTKINKTYPHLDDLNYHYYGAKSDPYLLGYNSANYDLTMLAIYLQEAFVRTYANPDQAQIYAQNAHGVNFYKIVPPTPQLLRKVNNQLFSIYKDRMPSILFNPPKPQKRNSYRPAYMIRRNMLRSGRHLDVSNLNAKMRKVGLKRLLGMLGYQILESSQLKPGTDHLENIDQVYELLAYNASDCINLACLMDHPYYQGQFQLMQTMLHTYPMIVYKKKADEYAPDISPATVKPNRMRIDSSSADVATNVVCPYGHLKDIARTSFDYPELRKSKEVHIKQFNVLKQTKEFFEKRVYGPAAKINLIAANDAKEQFDRIMNFYATVQKKNFDDSTNFYIDQLTPYNAPVKDILANLKDQDFVNMFSALNTFDLYSLKKYKGITQVQVNYNDHIYNIPRQFILNNKIVPDMHDRRAVNLGDLADYINSHSRGNKTKYLDKIRDFMSIYQEYQKKLSQTVVDDNSLDALFDSKPKAEELPINVFKQMNGFVKFITKAVFGEELTLNKDYPDNAAPSQLTFIKEDGKELEKLTMRPYVTKDLPVDNYCLPFFNADGTPSAGYALFSIGGIHGAEYNKELYDEDEAVYEREMMTNAGFSRKGSRKITSPILFKPNKSGAYALNEKYVYTSIDWANHEDFSSYYPSLCRMLNVYWNDGIGRDIYGEVYDRKEKLGHMMKDTEHYSTDEREYFHIMRQGTKLILNSTTGKGDTHGQNSPIQMNNNIISMRLIGQMFTWRIGQAQTLAGAKVISTNTDGLYTVMDNMELNDKILKQEVKEIHVRIDPERLYLISKDANNRIEEDAKTFKINTPSGGDLAAFNGPVPTHSLAHPAAVDKALGLYLQEIGKPDSPYYDKKLMKPFNAELGMKLLLRLKPIDNTDEDTLDDKRKRLNFYQNVVASQPGSDRYIFTSDEYFADPNDELFTHVDLDDSILPPKTGEMQLSLFQNNDLDTNKIHIIQHYNRIFYLKADSNLPYQFLYVAAGRKVPANIRASRTKNEQQIYDNGSLASYVLSKNGVKVNNLNKDYKEAKVVKMPSSQPEWPIIIVNQSLASLSEQEINNLIDNLDMNVYLDMLKQKYMHSWCNNVVYKHAYDKEKSQKIKELQRAWENQKA